MFCINNLVKTFIIHMMKYYGFNYLFLKFILYIRMNDHMEILLNIGTISC